MRNGFFLLLVGFHLLVLPAAAQSRLGPAYFLRHPGSEPQRRTRLGPGLGLAPPPEPTLSVGSVATPPAGAAIPTVQAAAAYAPLGDAPLAATGQPPFPTQEMARRRDLTGVFAYPPYDSYQNLPEFYRKRTLPDVYAEPLFIQLLRSAVGQPRLGH